MDKIQLKLRLNPDLVRRLKALHGSYGELSRVVGELLESYVKTKERRPTVVDNALMYDEAIRSR